jgi:hypothetical protein
VTQTGRLEAVEILWDESRRLIRFGFGTVTGERPMLQENEGSISAQDQPTDSDMFVSVEMSRVDQAHSTRKCHYTRKLNLETLVWTRGRKMPLSDRKDRMMCPQCGGRRISIIFDPKRNVRAQAI